MKRFSTYEDVERGDAVQETLINVIGWLKNCLKIKIKLLYRYS